MVSLGVGEKSKVEVGIGGGVDKLQDTTSKAVSAETEINQPTLLMNLIGAVTRFTYLYQLAINLDNMQFIAWLIDRI